MMRAKARGWLRGHGARQRPTHRARARRAGGPPRRLVDLTAAAAFLVFCFLLGGSSQDIALLSLTIGLVSLVAIGFALWRLTEEGRHQARPFAIAAVLLMALPALQLVPLPPGLWSALPGRDAYLPALRAVDLADVWRPLSLAPDRTLAGLFALLPVLAAALLFAPLDTAARMSLLTILIACLAVSALVAVSQIAVQGPYFYAITNRGSGVGFFSNRNHQALFVALGILLVMARWRMVEFGTRRAEIGVMAAGGLILILPLLLLTGSRSGLLTGVLAYVAGATVFLRQTLARQPRLRRWAILGTALALAAAALGLALLSQRLTALDRLLGSDASDLRAVNLPAVLAALGDYFPLGAGFGTFDPVFRQFEPYAGLSPSYFNHAHSDLVEIVLEGGLPAAALLGAVLVLLARKIAVLWLPVAGSPTRLLAKTGYLGLVLLGVGSLVDYPLRTPFMGVLAMLLATWCFVRPETDQGPVRGRGDGGLGSHGHIG